MHLHPGLRSATLQLAPAELGRLSIRIRVEGQRIHAVVRAETEEALSALERHVPELEAAFADQGFEEVSLELGLEREAPSHDLHQLASQDVSGSLARLVETEISPELGTRAHSSAIGVDTYA
jgi:flagellar hook-length control protein FliK